MLHWADIPVLISEWTLFGYRQLVVRSQHRQRKQNHSLTGTVKCSSRTWQWPRGHRSESRSWAWVPPHTNQILLPREAEHRFLLIRNSPPDTEKRGGLVYGDSLLLLHSLPSSPTGTGPGGPGESSHRGKRTANAIWQPLPWELVGCRTQLGLTDPSIDSCKPSMESQKNDHYRYNSITNGTEHLFIYLFIFDLIGKSTTVPTRSQTWCRHEHPENPTTTQTDLKPKL